MTDDVERDPLAGALRASLARHAAEAPAGDRLAEQIIGATGYDPAPRPPRRRAGWRTWTLPIVAAGAVGAVVTAVVAIENYHPGPDRTAAADSHRPGPTRPVSTVSPPAPTTAALARPLPTATQFGTATKAGLTHFHAVDSTFVGTDHGWLLGTADCLDGRGATCPAMLRTGDGGKNWTAAAQPPGNPALQTCADPCITQLRFASTTVGYAFSPTAFEMTTDGGDHWVRQPGGADALETLDGNVIRLVSVPSGCAEPCAMRVQTAAVGGTQWRTVTTLDTPVSPGLVRLVRVRGVAAVLVSDGPAGSMFGYPESRSWLYTSADDGATWSNRGDPCRSVPIAGQDTFDAVSVSAGTDGALGLLCLGDSTSAPRAVPLVADSVGARFRALADLPFDEPSGRSIALASRATILVTGPGGLYRSSDGGGSWRRTGIPTGMMMNPVGAPGFADDQTAHWLTDGARLWTTHDQGRTWSEVEFP